MDTYSKSDIFQILTDRLQYVFPDLHLQVHPDELILISDKERVFISIDTDLSPIVQSDNYDSQLLDTVLQEVNYIYNNFIHEITT